MRHPSDEMATATLSGHFPRCRAAVTPIPTPKIRNIAAAPIAIDNVKGSAVFDDVPDRPIVLERRTEAGASCTRYLPLGGPISRPATSHFMYSRYWTTRGLIEAEGTRAC